MIVVGIVIAVLLSAVVSVVIQQTFRSDTSMEKIKRYTSQKQAELDEYFAQQAKGLQGLKADLDTKQIEVRAAVKRMQAQIAEAAKTTESFKSPTENIEKIKDGIAAYENSLNELMEMTGALELNLDSVKRESSIVQKVTSRLSKQTQIVESVE